MGFLKLQKKYKSYEEKTDNFTLKLRICLLRSYHKESKKTSHKLGEDMVRNVHNNP